MKAVILAGGRGTRLAPTTTALPKSLMPVGDRPILDIITRQLQCYGIREMTLAVGYLAEMLMAYFGDGERFGLHIAYSCEDKPLGTAGPLSLIAGLSERFLVMNGDVLTTLDFDAMLAHHIASGAMCTVAVQARQIEIDLGVVEFDGQFQLTSYVEKPAHHYRASMGIYIFEPGVLDFIPCNQHLDLPDLMQQLMRAGERVNCYPFDGYWLDIGRPDDHAKARADIAALMPSLFRKS